MPVSCKCCLLSGRGLCDRPITRPEESYGVSVYERARVCVCVCVCEIQRDIRCKSNSLHLQLSRWKSSEVRHPRCVWNISNYKVYAYIVRHNYVLGGMLFTICKPQRLWPKHVVVVYI
jgi:hypothetical protein